MKYFCSKCGKTTEYNFNLPKFCSQCGYEFASAKSSKAPAEIKLNKINDNTQTIIEPDVEEDYTSPQINFKQVRPTFKVDVYRQKGETFGSLLDGADIPNNSTNTNIEEDVFNNNQNTNKKSSESILAEFQKEAGALRQK